MAIGWSFNEFVEQIYNIVYPIGICLDFDDYVDPNVKFPGTVWTQITDGRCVRAATTKTAGTVQGQIGSIVGSDVAKLVADNLPAHAHSMQQHTHRIDHSHGAGIAENAGSHSHMFSGEVSAGGGHTHPVSGSTGGGGGHTHALNGQAASAGAHTHNIILAKYNEMGSNNIGRSGSTNLDSTWWSDKIASSGAHTHAISGTATYAGDHTHSLSGSAALAGQHSHSFSGTTTQTGVHGHSISIPSFNGVSGLSSVDATGSIGAGTSFSVMNSGHYYARWKRVG